MAKDFEVLGAPGAAEFLNTAVDPCFGKQFAKSAKTCIECRAPVLIEGKIKLMREVCAARSRGADTPFELQKLSTRDVVQRLERGDTLQMIFREIIGGAPEEVAGPAARQLLVDRLLYLKSTGTSVPDVPKTKELLNGKHE